MATPRLDHDQPQPRWRFPWGVAVFFSILTFGYAVEVYQDPDPRSRVLAVLFASFMWPAYMLAYVLIRGGRNRPEA